MPFLLKTIAEVGSHALFPYLCVSVCLPLSHSSSLTLSLSSCLYLVLFILLRVSMAFFSVSLSFPLCLSLLDSLCLTVCPFLTSFLVFLLFTGFHILLIFFTGGNVVSLHSKEETDMLLPFVKYKRLGRTFYIGLLRSRPRGKRLFI